MKIAEHKFYVNRGYNDIKMCVHMDKDRRDCKCRNENSCLREVEVTAVFLSVLFCCFNFPVINIEERLWQLRQRLAPREDSGCLEDWASPGGAPGSAPRKCPAACRRNHADVTAPRRAVLVIPAPAQPSAVASGRRLGGWGSHRAPGARCSPPDVQNGRPGGQF